MSGWLTLFPDAYDRNARLKPAWLSGLPLVASIALLMPELGVIWGSIAGLAVYGGGSMLLIQICRDRGRTLQSRLYKAWGGKPSVTMLRYSDDRLDRLTKARYREYLKASVPDLALPSHEEEIDDPEKADEAYESANEWLLQQTADHARFELLFRENTNYGFKRNLAGLKPYALAMDAAAIGIILAFSTPWSIWPFSDGIRDLPAEWWFSLAITTVHSLVFTTVVRPDWVRLAAETYARRLLAACDVLDKGHV